MLTFKLINKFRRVDTSISNIGRAVVRSPFFAFFMLMSIPNIDTEYRNDPIRVRAAKGNPQSRPRCRKATSFAI